MTLLELLDELGGNILRDRSGLISGPDDRLWSDETLVRYINEAERRFARRALVLRVDADDEPNVCEVPLEAGVSTYTLNPKICAVMSVKYDTDRQDLVCINHQTLSGQWGLENQPNYITYGFSTATSESRGRPRSYWVDESAGVAGAEMRVKLKLDNTPTAAEAGKVLRMRVCRLPLNDLSLENADASPEVPSIYHIDMLEWAAYLALRNHDVDSEMRSKADDHKKRFEEVVAEARNEALKRMFAPIGWGFGRNGFSWVK